MAYGTVAYGLESYGGNEELLITVGRQSMSLIVQPALQQVPLPVPGED